MKQGAGRQASRLWVITITWNTMAPFLRYKLKESFYLNDTMHRC